MQKLSGAALFLVLAACSAPTNAPSTQVAAAGAAAAAATAAPEGEELIVDRLNVACDADRQYTCDVGGCQLSDPQIPVPIPVSLAYEGATGDVNFCIATGCDESYLSPLPHDRPDNGQSVTGVVLTPGTAETASAGPGPFFQGIAAFAWDGTAFQFVQYNAGSLTVWTGACRAGTEAAPAQP